MAEKRKLLPPRYTCPSCGYFGLHCPPYEKMGNPPWEDHGEPPYCQKYGEPSYDVCPCCAYEFGVEDMPMHLENTTTFQDYLRNQIKEGFVWFLPDLKPQDWDLADQLKKAGIINPNG